MAVSGSVDHWIVCVGWQSSSVTLILLCSPAGGKMMKPGGETPSQQMPAASIRHTALWGGCPLVFLIWFSSYASFRLIQSPPTSPSPLTSLAELPLKAIAVAFWPPHLSPGHPVLPKTLTQATGPHKSLALSQLGFWAPSEEKPDSFQGL